MIIFLGTDHAGFELKETIKASLEKAGYEVQDKGAHLYDGDDDYPDFIVPVAEAVAVDPSARGIILGGSGQGEAMTANRYRGVRAAVFYGGSEEIIRLSREHNDANILSLGARFLTEEEALKAVEVWLESGFQGGRHKRRIRKMDGS